MSPPPKGPLLRLGTHMRTPIGTPIGTPVGTHIRTHKRPKAPFLRWCTHIRAHGDTYTTYRDTYKDTHKEKLTFAALRYTFSKVSSTAPFYSNCTRPLTFENFVFWPGASYRSLQCLNMQKYCQPHLSVVNLLGHWFFFCQEPHTVRYSAWPRCLWLWCPVPKP